MKVREVNKLNRQFLCYLGKVTNRSKFNYRNCVKRRNIGSSENHSIEEGMYSQQIIVENRQVEPYSLAPPPHLFCLERLFITHPSLYLSSQYIRIIPPYLVERFAARIDQCGALLMSPLQQGINYLVGMIQMFIMNLCVLTLSGLGGGQYCPPNL